jgi:hypothetical protein
MSWGEMKVATDVRVGDYVLNDTSKQPGPTEVPIIAITSQGNQVIIETPAWRTILHPQQMIRVRRDISSQEDHHGNREG